MGLASRRGHQRCAPGWSWAKETSRTAGSSAVCRRRPCACKCAGEALRAGLHPLVGNLRIESSGGQATVTIKAEAPPQTFAAGVLSGARTPRQLAEKARLAAPGNRRALFETGAVARWYHDNGWSYPVEGESAAGLAGVQQFFEALGLSTPPKLELSRIVPVADGPGRGAVARLGAAEHDGETPGLRASSEQPALAGRVWH